MYLPANMQVFILLVAVALCAQASLIPESVREEWLAYKLTHSKRYENPSEERVRMQIFTENSRRIAEHNQLFEQGLKSFKMRMNKFGDMSHQEFVRTLNGFNSTARATKSSPKGLVYIPPANVQLPTEIDWRNLGAVTPVKDQGSCGSCWSFSSTGALEGQHFRKTNKLVSLSEQNLVDCTPNNYGCSGGWMDTSFAYIRDNNGVDTEESYPYEAVDGQCRFNPNTVGAVDSGFVDIPTGDEEALKAAVATVGPIAVAIDAGHPSFQFYYDGVYFEEQCSTNYLDHAVLAVGYGTEADGTDYWIVKNSWGLSWGEDGYLKMSRNRNNNCGIATQSSYPVV